MQIIKSIIFCATFLALATNDPFLQGNLTPYAVTISGSEKAGKYDIEYIWRVAIRAREGFRPTPYKCPAGLVTFGYGCVIDTDAERQKGELTESEAQALIFDYIENQVQQIESDYPAQYNRRQKIALSMLFANLDKGRFFARHPEYVDSLRVGAGIPVNVWQSVCRYKDYKTGQYKRSKGLQTAREFEIALYQNDAPKINAIGSVYEKSLEKQLKRHYESMD